MRPSEYGPRGIVLAIVACLLATLSFMAASLALTVRLQIRHSSAALNELQAEQLAQGALARVLETISADQPEVDHLGESWALIEQFRPESPGKSLQTWLGRDWMN